MPSRWECRKLSSMYLSLLWVFVWIMGSVLNKKSTAIFKNLQSCHHPLLFMGTETFFTQLFDNWEKFKENETKRRKFKIIYVRLGSQCSPCLCWILLNKQKLAASLARGGWDCNNSLLLCACLFKWQRQVRFNMVFSINKNGW